MFAAAASLVNNAVLTTFGVPAVLTHGTTSASAVGVLTPAAGRFNGRNASGGPADMLADGTVWERGDYVLSLRTEDIAASGITAGETATAGGRSFRIIDILDDFDGMTDLILRPRDR